MGQFKPMVKMMTTEPTVELKLKKGGKVEKKMQMGGDPAMAPAAGSMPARGGMAPSRAPMKPGLFARRRAMRGMGAGPAGPLGRGSDMMENMEARRAMAPAPAMKKGGETKAEHAAEMKKMAETSKKLKEHADKPASKAHKGLNTGGVVMGQAGFKNGGIIKTTAKKTTKMDTAHVDTNKGPTGGVKRGNAGGYAEGGSVAKSGTGGVTLGQGGYKEGGDVKKQKATGKNASGAPVAMPQGRKPAPKAVAINELSGTYKKGGPVMTPAQKRLDNIFQKENAPAMKAAKKMSNEKYGRKMAKGGDVKRRSLTDKFREESGFGDEMKDLVQRLTPQQAKREKESSDRYMSDGAVTETERSVTVVPGKKHGGKMAKGGSC
jgi:hypothetical protein